MGEYYLHENGHLIYKPHGGVDVTSSFVRAVWFVENIGRSPKAFVAFLKEAHRKGAKRDEVFRLANHNNLVHFVPDWEAQVFGTENVG